MTGISRRKKYYTSTGIWTHNPRLLARASLQGFFISQIIYLATIACATKRWCFISLSLSVLRYQDHLNAAAFLNYTFPQSLLSHSPLKNYSYHNRWTYRVSKPKPKSLPGQPIPCSTLGLVQRIRRRIRHPSPDGGWWCTWRGLRSAAKGPSRWSGPCPWPASLRWWSAHLERRARSSRKWRRCSPDSPWPHFGCSGRACTWRPKEKRSAPDRVRDIFSLKKNYP